ncbi:hypothetical protein GCM10027273_07880 [Nocardioides pakistanensis]
MPRKAVACRYVTEWVAVMTQCKLTVNRAEKRTLLTKAQNCRNMVVTVRTARVVRRSTTSSGSGLDPRFSTCTEVIAHGYGLYYRGVDDECWWCDDRDDDGVVCE